MKKYFSELDSLRGLAALSVVFHHYLLILPFFDQNTYGTNNWLNIIKYSPLHFFWFGYEPVLFFFVLSGFVLALSFYSKGYPNYSHFVVKRFFRIYVPYYIATVVAMILYSLVSRNGILELSNWFNSLWVEPVTMNSLLNHLLLIKYFGYGQYVPVLWTLAVEVRISLLFPLIMRFLLKYSWEKILMAWVGSSAFYYTLRGSGIEQQLSFIPSDYFYTLSFISMFIAGALLAKYHFVVTNFVKKLTPTQKIILLVTAGLLYTSRYWLFFSEGVNGTHTFWSDTAITIGIVLIIVLAISTRMSRILRFKPLLEFGQMSYSVYLYHAVFLAACLYLFYSRVPLFLILVMAFIATIFISYASYTWVEKPSMKIAKHLQEKLQKKSK